MKLSIQKFMMLFAAAISLLQIPISHANGLDARLHDDMQAKHYEPGGKYHLFGNGRGSVKNRVYSVHTFGTTAVGPVLPITHERTGFEGVMKPIFQDMDMKYTVRLIIMIQEALLISVAV